MSGEINYNSAPPSSPVSPLIVTISPATMAIMTITADIVYRDPSTYRQFKTFTQEFATQGFSRTKLDWLVGGQ